LAALGTAVVVRERCAATLPYNHGKNQKARLSSDVKSLVEFIWRCYMNKQAVIFFCLLILGGVTSCGLPDPYPNGQEDFEVSQKYSTVSALLTQTAVDPAGPHQVETVPETTQVVMGTSQVDVTPELTPVVETPEVVERTSDASRGQAMTLPCLLARPGHPLDITVPDDTIFYPGLYFSKTWRLVNAGSCTWTNDFSVVWFSGDDLALSHAQPLLSNVSPGDSVEVTVEMIAPQRPGTFQSNWKLRDSQGELFGIGPIGDSPFWVRIEVMPVITPTATPALPEATPTALVFASGSLTLDLDMKADLDGGQVEVDENHDLVLLKSEEEELLIFPENNARLMFFGLDAPNLQDCLQAAVSDAPVDLLQVQAGSYLCYRTDQGLPGRIYLSAVDLEQSMVDFEFVTWVVP